MRCFMCKAPFHISSGQLFGHQSTPFCSRCSKSMIEMVVERRNAWYNGAKFYNHASTPPPAATHNFASEFEAALLEAGSPISREVAVEVARAHIEHGREEAAAVLTRNGVKIQIKRGGRFGAGGTPCTSYQVNEHTIMMG